MPPYLPHYSVSCLKTIYIIDHNNDDSLLGITSQEDALTLSKKSPCF